MKFVSKAKHEKTLSYSSLTEEELESRRQEVKEEKAILAWESNSRPFKKRSSQYFITVILIAIFFSLLAILIKEFIAILVIGAALFVSYVLAIVPPDKINHKISRSGFTSGLHAYLWSDLRSFWFENRMGCDVLVIETNLRFPNRLIVVLDSVSKNAIKEVLSKHIEFREVPLLSWLDKITALVAEKLPLESRE